MHQEKKGKMKKIYFTIKTKIWWLLLYENIKTNARLRKISATQMTKDEYLKYIKEHFQIY